MFAREASSSEIIKGAMADVIFLANDCEKGEGPAIAKKFGIRGYPTYYAVNAKGEPIERWIGYDTAQGWADRVAAARRDTRTLVEKKAAFAIAPTAELAETMANDVATDYDWAGSVAFFKQTRELAPARADELTRMIFMYMAEADPTDFTFEDIRIEGDRVLNAVGTTAEDRVELGSLMMNAAESHERLAAGIPYLERALGAATGLPDDSKVARTVKFLQITHALMVEKNTQRAVDLRKSLMPENWQQEARRLNQFAAWCLDNGVNLDEADGTVLKAVELAKTDAERGRYLATAAEIALKRGDANAAVERGKQALALDPANEDTVDLVARAEAALAGKAE